MNDNNPIPEDKWQAIIGNDSSYDDKFWYAVKTTGIFCRPSCKSKAPKMENVRVFEHPQQALAANFRPCKRCKPTGERLPDQEWVVQITAIIEKNFNDNLTLETLADMCHGSPYHLHRTFKRIKGITPVEFTQAMRMNKAMEYLVHSDKSIADVASSVGMPNTSYFITLFKKRIGHTPNDYRQLNKLKPARVEELHNERGN